jgi:iron complex outermembrane receptor protein
MTFKSMACAAAILTATAVVASPHDAAAETARRHVELAPATLDRALPALSRALGEQIIFSKAMVRGYVSPPLAGMYTTEEALHLALRSSGLTYRRSGGGVIMIEPAPPHVTPAKMTFAAAAPAAAAAATPAAESSTIIEELVVTAQKRAEPLSKTAVAISALSSGQLQDAGVTSIRDLTSVAPNLEVTTVGPANSIMIATRGVFNADFNPSGNPAVSTYVDGVYVGRTAGLGGAFYDLERIEVLRGPQGTLYGRNSTGGNVNVITAAPAQDLHASADVAYGNYNDVQVQGMLNVPVSDALAVRGAMIVHRNDGYYDTQGTTSRNYWKAEDYGGRLSVLFTPTSSLKWRLTAEKFAMRGTPGYSIDSGRDGKPVDGLPVFRRPIPNRAPPINEVDNLLIRSRVDAALNDKLSLAYIAGYQKLDIHSEYSLTQSTYDGFRLEHTHSQFHEVNVTFDAGAFSNIAGGTYFNQDIKTGDSYRLPVLGLFSDTAVGQLSHGKLESWGVFDQVRLALGGRLHLTGGVRYSWERASRDAGRSSFCPLALYPNIPLAGPDFFGPGCILNSAAATADSWDSVTWKANLEFNATESLFLYAGVTTGFKSGGLNPAIVGIPNYSPEKVINYEGGIKYFPRDLPFNFSATLYYMDYSDIQGYGFIGVSGVTTNANGAEIYGAELEGQWRPTPDDRFSAFFTYTHATYTKYLNAVDQQLGTIYPDISGNTLPHAPRFTARVEYAHEFKLANGGTITPKAAVYWQSKSYLRDLNLPIDRIRAYTKTNLNLAYDAPGGRWTAEAFVHNLEDRRIRNYALTALGRYFSDYHPPRTYGVRIAYRY